MGQEAGLIAPGTGSNWINEPRWATRDKAHDMEEGVTVEANGRARLIKHFISFIIFIIAFI